MRTLLTPPLKTLLRHEGKSRNPEISLVFCDDEFIQALNKTYRGLDKATDVLSFAQEDDDYLGDIVISVPTAERQAATAGWGIENELTLLSVHGLLHLLGYDDESVGGAREMQDKTAHVLQECGIVLPSTGNHPFFMEIDQ